MRALYPVPRSSADGSRWVRPCAGCRYHLVMRWGILGIIAALLIASSPAPSTRPPKAANEIPRISPVPITPTCSQAPAAAVEAINATLLPGEHLEHAQTIDVPFTLVGANIVDASGTRVSSHDSWIIWHGKVFGLSSDAWQRSGDGRDLIDGWSEFNDVVGECVGSAN